LRLINSLSVFIDGGELNLIWVKLQQDKMAAPGKRLAVRVKLQSRIELTRAATCNHIGHPIDRKPLVIMAMPGKDQRHMRGSKLVVPGLAHGQAIRRVDDAAGEWRDVGDDDAVLELIIFQALIQPLLLLRLARFTKIDLRIQEDKLNVLIDNCIVLPLCPEGDGPAWLGSANGGKT